MLTALPVLMALSWVPAVQDAAEQAAPVAQTQVKSQASGTTITCPLTGQPIPSCCCPVKK